METFYIILTLILALPFIGACGIIIGCMAGIKMFKHYGKFDDNYYNSGKIRKEDY